MIPYRFGIVAAMSRNNVIGIDGRIPWRVPHDRQIFKSLTSDRIMILGRRTLEEHPRLEHINHAAVCIVVSRSLERIEVDPKHAPETRIELARSFPEALILAKSLEKTLCAGAPASQRPIGDINCWVAGGETLYLEALQHESATEVHLSVVDIVFEIEARKSVTTTSVAMFPSLTKWSDRFEECQADFYHTNAGYLNFTHYVYRRKKE